MDAGSAQYVVGGIVALLCAVICGTVAEKKGLSSVWWLLGIVFGVLAVIGVLLIPSRAPATPASPVGLASDEMRCPDCAETIKRAAVRCRFCGKQLQSASF